MTCKLIAAKAPGEKEATKCVEFSTRKSIIPKIHPKKFRLEDINEMLDLVYSGKIEDGYMVVEFF